MAPISKKICLIGDFAVGKTSLIRRFVERQFEDKYLSTVGVKISRKSVEIDPVQQTETLKLQLLIWDIEGSTKFKGIAPSYLQGAKAAIVVADASRKETIDHLLNHIDQFLSVNPKGLLAVALNKADLVDTETLKRLLSIIQYGDRTEVLGTYSTSAKTGQNVDEIFQKLAYEIVNR